MQETEPANRNLTQRNLAQDGGPLADNAESQRLPESGATEGPVNVYDRPDRANISPGMIIVVLLIIIALAVAFFVLPNLF